MVCLKMIYDLRIPLEFLVENFSVLDTAYLIHRLSAAYTALVGRILETFMENFMLQWSLEAAVSFPLLK